MSTTHHGAGGSYVIDEAGSLNLQHRTKSREEAAAEEAAKSAQPAPTDTRSTDAAADKPADAKKTATSGAAK